MEAARPEVALEEGQRPGSDEAARPGETPHGYLRRVTRPWHDGVEAAFARFDPRTRAGLSGFLVRQAMALLPLERTLEAAGVGTLLADWAARRRAALLMADLARLGVAVPPTGTAPDLPDRPHMLGALYVLEGSKLGGRVLHRRVLESPDPDVRGAAAFLGHRHERGWTLFLSVLDGVPLDAASLPALRAGAETTFAAFRAAAQHPGAARPAEPPTRFGLDHHAHA